MTYSGLNAESFDKGGMCYMVHHHTPYIWISDACTKDNYFACEKIIPGGCDNRTFTTLNASMLTYNINTPNQSCQKDCASNSSCWAGITTNTGQCLLMAFQTENQRPSGVTMFQKSCVKVETVPPDEIPTVTNPNTDTQPSLNCNTTNTEIIQPSSHYDSLSETETVNITAIVTSTSEAHLTTLPLDIFSTLMTITETYTSTIYETKTTETCFNISNVFLSTNDPLLIEAMSSMKQELHVDKKTTTAYKRSKISAPDKRTSSRVIGACGLIILIIPVSLIIITDIPAVVRQFKVTLNAFRNKQFQCRKRNN
ncbi:unnamed protein product [Mytilus edulis]|uniref:Apple domain-containing protein n=1 Tax=Mytilus edulis TaxID=6550 RepID=A0A8S3S2E2_MYTED|nr:unnamed protein product [Mytilus edulis]